MNKKGFTLIELLAVIIVLGLVILITTPIILGVIDDSRRGAAKDSMYLYVKAVEMAISGDPKIAGLLEGTYTTKDGDLYSGTTRVVDVDTKGTKPLNGGSVTIVSGDLEEAKLSIGGYLVTYKNKKATVS